MIEPESIGWWNTGFPLMILTVLAIILPRVFVPKTTLSHRRVMVGIATSLVLILIAGALVFAGVYAARMEDLWGAVMQDPGGAVWFFATLSLYSMLLWVPILALVWFGMAQSVEQRRGDDLAKRGMA